MCCRQRGRPRADPSDPRESSVRASSARAVWSSRSTLAAPRRARTDSASTAPGRRVHTSTCCASRCTTTRTRAVARSSPVTRASEASTNHRSRAPARPPCQCDALFAGRRLGDAHASIVARRQPARTRSRLKHVGTTPRKAPTSSRRQRGRAVRPLPPRRGVTIGGKVQPKQVRPTLRGTIFASILFEVHLSLFNTNNSFLILLFNPYDFRGGQCFTAHSN